MHNRHLLHVGSSGLEEQGELWETRNADGDNKRIQAVWRRDSNGLRATARRRDIGAGELGTSRPRWTLRDGAEAEAWVRRVQLLRGRVDGVSAVVVAGVYDDDEGHSEDWERGAGAVAVAGGQKGNGVGLREVQRDTRHWKQAWKG